jgi:hypothetical protein
MTNADESWSEVGDHFTRLGRKFRDHYEAQDRPSEVQANLEEAFKGLAEATQRVAATIGEVFRDPEVKEEAGAAASSFITALGATFGEVTDELRRRFEESGPPTEAEVGEAAPPEGEPAPDSEPPSPDSP